MNRYQLPLLLSLITTSLLPACDQQAAVPARGDDRVVINGDAIDLSAYVAVSRAPVPLLPTGLTNGLVFVPELRYELTVVAEVAPPVIDGVELQATSIAFDGQRAVVSYNTAGDVQQGAIDVFALDGQRNLKLTSRAIFNDTDVNAIAAAGGRVWLATATADESFAAPAVLEGLSISQSGVLNLDDHVRVGLSSFAGTSVAVAEGRVFATSGDGGGVHAFDPASGAIVASAKLSDARWVAAPGDGTLVVLRGTPGRLDLLAADDLEQLGEYAFDGASLPESKSTVQVVGGKAIIAGGPGGTIVIDLATGATIAQIAPPSALAQVAGQVVTNAVSVDGDLMFIANGAAGVYMVASSQPFATPFDSQVGAPKLAQVGRLMFPGDLASVNHIAYQDGFLFVASGRGGLKIVRVDDLAASVPTPSGYPYLSGFGQDSERAGWRLAGDWGWGAPDGERTGVAGAFLDNNPSLFDQQGVVADTATLELSLAIPESDSPTLSFAYDAAFLSPDDSVEVQLLRNSGNDWKAVMSFGQQSQRAHPARRIYGLDAYRGETVRMRFVQHMGAVSGVRRFTIDDLAVAPLVLPTLSYPFETSFESELERSRWNLEGSWDWSFGGAFDGGAELSVNPTDAALAGYDKGQQAELLGFIPVPTGGNPVVGFWYRADLVDGTDVVVLDVQTEGKGTWDDLASFKPERDSTSTWAYHEVSLADHRGQNVRFRFGSVFGRKDGARAFAVDSLRVGPLVAGEAAFPYANDFEGPLAASLWLGQGVLAVAAHDDGGSGIVSDLDAIDVAAEGEAHMIDYVSLPATGPLQLSFRAAIELVAQDQLVVEGQRRGDSAWAPIAAYGAQQSHSGWTRYEVSLDAFAGQSLRLRFRVAFGASPGHVIAIDDVAVTALPSTRFAYPFAAELDAESLASWVVNGAWTPVDGLIDANPGRLPQAAWGPGQELAMPGFVPVPAAGRPTLFVSLDLGFTDPDDVLFLELQTSDDATWTTLRRYTAQVNRGGFGWDELALDAFANRAVRVRLRYELGGSASPRRIRVGDLRIEDLAPHHFGTPFANGLDSLADVAQWSLWGAWRADGFLDGNPNGAIQSAVSELQTATTVGEIAVPADNSAWLGFKHHFGAVRSDDALEVQVQPNDSSTWSTVATLDKQHVRAGFSAVELPLDAWAGRSLRVRFSLRLGATDVVREIAVDDIWLGQLVLPDTAAPLTVGFGTPEAVASWDLSGLWQVSDKQLSFNVEGIDNGGYATFQTATFGSFVRIADLHSAKVTMSFGLKLVHDADRAYVEILRPASTRWVAVAVLTNKDNDTDAKASWPISGRDPVRLRVRVEAAATPGVRQLRVSSIGIVK